MNIGILADHAHSNPGGSTALGVVVVALILIGITALVLRRKK